MNTNVIVLDKNHDRPIYDANGEIEYGDEDEGNSPRPGGKSSESDYRVTSAGGRLVVESSDCGANADGGGGFVAGNDCASGDGGGAKGFPNEKLVGVIDNWMKDNGTSEYKKWTKQDGYLPLPSSEKIQAIADEQQGHNGQAPTEEALKSYASFKTAILGQYKALVDAGLKVYAWEGHGEPYKESEDTPFRPSSKNMVKKVAETGEFHFFMTKKGFGEGQGADEDNAHPMLQMSPMKTADGKPMLYNDVFRVAHDAVAHLYGGFNFGTRGEMNGMVAHASTLPKEARAALFAETFAQNAVYDITNKFAEQNIYVSKNVGMIDELLAATATPKSMESLMESQNAKSQQDGKPPVDEDEDSDFPIGAGRLRRRPEGSPLDRDGGEEASQT